MACIAKVNSINYLVKYGATNDVRKIIDFQKFDKENDYITGIAETKYGLKLFSIQYEATNYLKDSPYYREKQYTTPRAIPNEVLFEELDRLIRIYNMKKDQGLNPPDQPMMMRTPEVSYNLKIINGLNKISRNKFEPEKLQGWLNDLQKQGVPAQQLEMFKEVAKPGMTKDQIALELAALYSYTVEINISEDSFARTDLWSGNENDFIPLEKRNTQIYSNLTVPGGTNYTEQEISTPLITPTIKGHAQFSTDQGIGWFRSDDKENKVVGWKEEDDFLNSETAEYNPITKNDKIIWGHPTIGKSYLKKDGDNRFISLDDDYSKEIIDAVDKISKKYNVTTYQVKDGGTQEWNNEYNKMMQDLFDMAKQKAISENKILFTSNTELLKNNLNSFDKVINLSDAEFQKRIQARGAKYDTKKWKSEINEVISKISSNKIINTDKYLSDLLEGNPKTRRILEVQSDLFQKGRDKKLLTGEYSKLPIGAKVNYKGKVYAIIDKYEKGDFKLYDLSNGNETITGLKANEFIDIAETTQENQFLQLLNKDGNWVTFFVKSIITYF